MDRPCQVLTIAGSDSGAGAGIQADLKAIAANGGYGLVAITAVTAQNTREVAASLPLPAEIVRQQIDAVCSDFDVAATKTGMLATAEIVAVVAEALANRGLPNLVVDPVMISTSGFSLLEEAAVEALRARLLPLARICTPNRPEAEALSGVRIASLADAREAARRIQELGPRAVLVKGGHLDDREAVDLLLDGDEVRTFRAARVVGRGAHGTGCTLSAALATWLGRGEPLARAVDLAKRFVTEALRGGLAVGHGHRPTNPFFFLRGRDWTHFTAGPTGGGQGETSC